MDSFRAKLNRKPDFSVNKAFEILDREQKGYIEIEDLQDIFKVKLNLLYYSNMGLNSPNEIYQDSFKFTTKIKVVRLTFKTFIISLQMINSNDDNYIIDIHYSNLKKIILHWK